MVVSERPPWGQHVRHPIDTYDFDNKNNSNNDYSNNNNNNNNMNTGHNNNNNISYIKLYMMYLLYIISYNTLAKILQINKWELNGKSGSSALKSALS